MTLPSGTLLSQRYEIRSFVGSDGTVEVYKALDLRLGRDVAVTVLEIRNLQDPGQLMKFEREAQIRAGLHHPRIMTIHDFGHDTACVFQVAEWLNGNSLRVRLKMGLTDWPEAARIGQAVLEGLAVIHACGFTLKVLDSASVFLQNDGSVKLFAYDMKRIDSPGTAAFSEAETSALQALSRLLIRCLAGENPVPSVFEQSRRLSALREFAELAGSPELRTRFTGFLQETSELPPQNGPRRWIAAGALVLCLPSLAILFIHRARPEKLDPLKIPAAKGSTDTLVEPHDSDARRLFLYGMQLLDNRDPESLRRAQTYLQGAATRDPSLALAYCGIADCHSLMGMAGILPKDEALRLSQGAIQKALEINPKLGEAHASQAFLDCWYKLDWMEAEKNYRQALESAPKQARIHDGFGWFLISTGRLDDGLKHLSLALELEPLSRPFRTDYAIALHWAGLSKESMDEFAKTLEEDPMRSETLLSYRTVLEQLGRMDEALNVSARLAELGTIPDRDASALKTAFETHGAKGYLNERIRQQEQSHSPEPVSLAELVALQGDKDRAFRLLARALREGSPLAGRIPEDPAFESMRLDPRFRQILKQMHAKES